MMIRDTNLESFISNAPKDYKFSASALHAIYEHLDTLEHQFGVTYIIDYDIIACDFLTVSIPDDDAQYDFIFSLSESVYVESDDDTVLYVPKITLEVY